MKLLFLSSTIYLLAITSAIAPDVSPTLQNILDNTDGSDLYTYPTDLTRGIVPRPIHSHNDYWRDVPFYSALSVGCISVEADVWLYNDTLHVGHEESALTEVRTFQSLYINPILDVLTRENPNSSFVTSQTHNGVFDGYSSQTLYLWVDVKTPGETTWPSVVSALTPLLDGGWLSRVDGNSIIPGAVTVIGTGNTPLDQIQPVPDRYYFYDAPIPYLNTTFSNITNLVSPIASTDFASQFGTINGTGFNNTQLALLRSQIAVAKSKGIGTRYWELPAWPISTRNAVWKTLVDEGVALINADDLVAAAGFSDDGNYW
ncbi:hypothetical protein MMC12_007574 [Toensbergia leucococca]|nr:hypothetical protein [Toensbergia leucococca]